MHVRGLSNMKHLSKGIFLAAALSLVAACGGGGGQDDSGGAVTQPPPVTSIVQSVGHEGGEISLPGQIDLIIPPNALSSGTDIVLTRIAGEPGAYDARYEFEPDGLAFNIPVEIRMTYDRAILPPEVLERNLFLANLTENMHPLADSVVDTAGQTITASTSHFSAYGLGHYAPTGVFVSQFDSRIAAEWRMPIGDRGGNDVGADLRLLDIDQFPISGYPRIRFNEFGDPNDWYVATAHNRKQWLNNGPNNEPSNDENSSYPGGAYHPGEDWNTVAATVDDDLGLPVRAVGRGIVLYSKTSFDRRGFGNIVIIGHRLGSGELVASVYAHLQNAPTLSAGALVDPGDLVGFLGQTGFAFDSPHLHFEIARESALSIDQTGEIRIPVSTAGNWFWAGGDTNFIADNYYDPSSFIASAGASTLGTTRVSVDSSGIQGNEWSGAPSISADGRFIAFESAASNLVSDDTNGVSDVFVHDRQTGMTTRVSVDLNGLQGNDRSGRPSISADGRFVAFGSYSSNLVDDDTNGAPDIFVHDRDTHLTTRLIIDPSGRQSVVSWFGDAWGPSISADGRFVAFPSEVLEGDVYWADVLVHDRQTGVTTPVNSESVGGEIGDVSISADGRFVVYYSDWDDLVVANPRADVFRYDRQSQSTIRVSVSSSGGQGNHVSTDPSISADGRFVAFRSFADNLVPGDVNGTNDIFVHDSQTLSVVSIVSVSSTGEQGNAQSTNPSISANGRFVAFYSEADNLVEGDSNSSSDIFVHDRQTGATILVSVTSSGEAGNGMSGSPAISADGRSVAFTSFSDDLVDGDTNGTRDVFVRQLP